MLPGALCRFASKSLEVHRVRYNSYTSGSLATWVRSATLELYLLPVFFAVFVSFVGSISSLRLDPSASVVKKISIQLG